MINQYEILVIEINTNHNKAGACWSEVFDNDADAFGYMQSVDHDIKEFNKRFPNNPATITMLCVVHENCSDTIYPASIKEMEL